MRVTYRLWGTRTGEGGFEQLDLGEQHGLDVLVGQVLIGEPAAGDLEHRDDLAPRLLGLSCCAAMTFAGLRVMP
ncbi:MAG: hypothetical protein ABJA34_03295 [Pseudonocardiales bacterium]